MNINNLNSNTSFSSVRILGATISETKQIVTKIVDKVSTDGDKAFFQDIISRQNDNPYVDILILNKKEGLDVKVVDKGFNDILYEPADTNLSDYNINLAKRRIVPCKKSEHAGMHRFAVYLPTKFPNQRNLKSTMTYLSDSKCFCLLERILPNFKQLVYADKFASDIVEKMSFLK